MKTASKFILTLLMCLCLPGCATLKNVFSRKDPLPPQAFAAAAQPTLEQITSTVNGNSQSIRNFTTENASLHLPGMVMPLQTRLTFERPKRIRIQGSISSFGGQEFDFGSNDILFWLWTRRGTDEMWYCRHDQYPLCPVRSTIPIDPDWLIEALGMVEFRPNDQHFGPTRTEGGHWEIISHCQTPSGQFVKRTVIDSKNGHILRLELHTPQNEPVALAEIKETRYDKVNQVYYVKRVEVLCQGMPGKMTLDLGTPTINLSASFDPLMFVMPKYEGYRAVDLCSPEFLQPRGTVMPVQMPTSGHAVPEASIQTVIR